MKPAELSRTNSTLEIETVISDAVGVSVIYEYAYLGDSPSSGVDGDETWHLIGEDSSPVRAKYMIGRLPGENIEGRGTS